MSDAHAAKAGGGEEGGGAGNPFVDAIFWILFILVTFSVVKGALGALHISFGFLPSLTEIFATIFNTVQVFSIFLSLLFFIGIIYFNFKLGELAHHGHGDHGHGGGHEHSHGHDTHSSEAHTDNHHASHDAHTHPSDKRWQNVLVRLESFNEGDWRLAIIEADILLDDMLNKMGYPGEGIAEKLKQADKTDFHTLDDAWEAHKIRNRIAHDGTAFHLTKHEAERVIGLFKKVFEEFYFI